MLSKSNLHKPRLNSINLVMEGLHDSLNEVYESLVDREYSQTKKDIASLIDKLNELNQSLSDEV